MLIIICGDRLSGIRIYDITLAASGRVSPWPFAFLPIDCSVTRFSILKSGGSAIVTSSIGTETDARDHEKSGKDRNIYPK